MIVDFWLIVGCFLHRKIGRKLSVVIQRGCTAVKFVFRLRLEKKFPPYTHTEFLRVMARVSTTKHQHKPNQQKLTTQIKQPKIKLSGTNRTIERNARKERQKIKIEWNE